MVISQRKAIQKKLMAATSMLLVACIMLISASYAWFTLSTAPEITGITTNVGANGNLEIALATTETWNNPENVLTTTSKNDNVTVTNTTWGNLVALSDAAYGLSGITLMPARLNIVNASNKVASKPLSVATYGSDGRISGFDNADFGQYSTDPAKSGYIVGTTQQRGVNAIGTADGMTERQAAYRNSKADFSDGATGVSGIASSALSAHGSTLASIAVAHGLASEGKEETYTPEQYNAVKAVLESLAVISDDLDTAWENAVLAYAASVEGEKVTAIGTEEKFKEFITKFQSDNGYTYEDNIVKVTLNDGTEAAITLPESFKTFKVKAAEVSANIAAAQGKVVAEKDSYTWTDISAILEPLVATNGITVNGFTVAAAKENISKLISSIGGGIIVELSEGSGVFYDIAALCGNYGVNIFLNINAGGFEVENMSATMKTAAGTVVANAVAQDINSAGTPQGEGAASTILTDLYAYQIDFLLRTNASNSNLLLQQEGTQRIYDDSTNTETLGLGSTMTFQSSSSAFGVESMINLMKNIRVVFTDYAGNIVGIAVLDFDFKTAEDGIVTDEYLNAKVDEATSTVTACLKLVEFTFTDGVLNIGANKFGADEDQVLIKDMPANTAVPLSALVYLDGDAVTNADVANAATSMTGALNLQFASSATLVPMDNTALKGEATSSETPSGS